MLQWSGDTVDRAPGCACQRHQNARTCFARRGICFKNLWCSTPSKQLAASKFAASRRRGGQSEAGHHARRDLGDLLEFALTLRSLCDLTFGSPRERRWAIERAEHLDERGIREQDADTAPTRDAHAVAQELVVMARAEALTTLGEHPQGVDVVEAWMREHDR